MAIYKVLITSDPEAELAFLGATQSDVMDICMKIALSAGDCPVMFPAEGVSDLRYRICSLENSAEQVTVCFMLIDASRNPGRSNVALVFDVRDGTVTSFETHQSEHIRQAILSLAKAYNQVSG